MSRVKELRNLFEGRSLIQFNAPPPNSRNKVDEIVRLQDEAALCSSIEQIQVGHDQSNKNASVSKQKDSAVLSQTVAIPEGRALQTKLLVSQSRLHEVDTFVALPVPESSTSSCKALSQYLTERFMNGKEDRPVRELRALRAIARWVGENISYDVESYHSGNITHSMCQDENVLKSRTSVCSGYANLVETLAKHAQIKVQTISGYAKGASYNPAKDVKEGDTNHAWNVATIGGVDFLLDSTWAAGHSSNSEFVREWNEHYWLTDPTQFIVDHFPEEKKWQLLKSPVEFADFLAMPYLRSAFFKSGLEITRLDLKNKVLIRVGESFSFQIREKKGKCSLSHDVHSFPEGNKTDIEVANLESDGSFHTVTIKSAVPGTWSLNLFVGPKGCSLLHGALELYIEITA